jgi:hypothetical protein
MTRTDVPLGKGQCDIRLQVDGEAEVSLRGDRVFVRTISGRDARDDGSECNEPLPGRNLDGFNFSVRDSRGDIALLSEPNGRNGYRAVVRIRDSQGGEGRYHFRIEWRMTGGERGSSDDRGYRNNDRVPYNDRSHWNDRGRVGTVDFSGRGRGTYDRENEHVRRINNATIRVDGNGGVRADFQTEDGRRLSFAGRVTEAGRGTIRADVAAGNSRSDPQGPMVITLDGSGQVSRVTVDGYAGRDRFRLDWNR